MSYLICQLNILKIYFVLGDHNTANHYDNILSKNDIDPNLYFEESTSPDHYFTLENIFSNDIFNDFEDLEFDILIDSVSQLASDDNHNNMQKEKISMNTSNVIILNNDIKINENENHFEEININTDDVLVFNNDTSINNERTNQNQNVLDKPELAIVLDINEVSVKRNRIPQQEKWKRKNNKQERMFGLEYVGYQRKGKLVEHNVAREPRSLDPPCTSRFCLKAVYRFCNQFEESQRKEIFLKFWEEKKPMF